jgi:hypothetical protein
VCLSANVLNEPLRSAYKDWSSGVVVGWTTKAVQSRKPECYEMLHNASVFAASYEQSNEHLEPYKVGNLLLALQETTLFHSDSFQFTTNLIPLHSSMNKIL